MPTIGTINSPGYALAGLNYANQVQTVLTMPTSGWLINAHVAMGGNTSNPWVSIVLWRGDNGQIIWNSNGFLPGTGISTQTVSVPNVRMPGGAPFRVGFWRTPGLDAVWGLDTAYTTNWSAESTPGSIGPSAFVQTVPPWSVGQLSATVDYVANATPNTGAWQSPTPSGTISDTNPTVSGTLPQNPADSAYESVGQINWQITRTDTGSVVASPTWSLNANVSSFSAKPSDFGITLIAGLTYKIQFQYSDSWGVWSGFNSGNTFTISAGPNPPNPTAPAGKINQVSSISYQAIYNHPSSKNAQAVQAMVFAGSTVTASPLYDSGTVTQTVTPGSTYTISQWHQALNWGSQYCWWTRAQDTSGIWGPWSAVQAYNTDAAPNPPTPISPANGAVVR